MIVEEPSQPAGRQEIRWGVLGCARIGDVVVPAIRACPGHRVLAAASRSQHRAAETAARWRIPRWYASYDRLLDDPEVDAVYLPLPNALHAGWTLKAIRAGKHVLCEKPLALSASEVDEVAAAAELAGVIVTEAFAYRHHALTERVIDLVQEGAVGRPRLVRGSFTFLLAGEGDIRLDRSLGGGALWDVGCYPVSYARAVLHEDPAEASGRQTTGPTGVDVEFVGRLLFPSGAVLELDCGFWTPFRTWIEIVGSRGAITVERPFLPGLRESIMLTLGGRVETLRILGGDPYVAQVEAFGDAITGRQPPRITLADTRANTVALAALHRSAREGRAVAVESDC
ncbi:MAG: Gfo/Idh/MocA family oxidoreductase [Thermoanaerobaculia bacterium]